VELVYGYATWPLRGRLPVWGTVAAAALFSVLMYAAVGLRDRGVNLWRLRRHVSPANSAEAAVA